MLIALAIVAMSVGALLGTVTSSASNVIYLKDKTLAEWVALNRLTEVRIDQDMPAKGKRSGNTVMAGMRWEWQEEVVELPIKGMFRIEVRAHATGEFVDDTRAVDKPTAQTLSPSTSSGSSNDTIAWTTTVIGVVGSARSDVRDAVAAPIVGNLQSGNPQSPGNPPGRRQPGTPGRTAQPAQDLGAGPADAHARLHTHRSGDRDVHRGHHVCDRLRRDQPGAASIAMRSTSRRSGSRRSSAACAWSRRISRRSWRARARDTSGTGQLMPAMFADGRSDIIVTFTRAGWSNPAGIQRPAEQRVRYRFIDGSLVREHWLSVDPALNTEPRQRMLLTQGQGRRDPLPRSGVAPMAHRLADVGVDAARSRRPCVDLLLTRPLAIEFTVVFEDWGRVHAPVRDPHVKHARQRGIALLVAIVMFAIATTVAAAITYNKAMAARRAAATFALEQALQAGMAAEALARHRARRRRQEREDRRPTKPGREPLGPVEIEGTGIWIQAQLEDLTARFNLNTLVKWQGPPDNLFVDEPGAGRRCSASCSRR